MSHEYPQACHSDSIEKMLIKIKEFEFHLHVEMPFQKAWLLFGPNLRLETEGMTEFGNR